MTTTDTRSPRSRRRDGGSRTPGGPLLRAAVATGLAALTVTTTACGGGQAAADPTGVSESDVSRIAAAASHHASASPEASSSSPSASSSAAAASGSGAASALPPEFAIPAAAKAHTKEGAKAFVKFYWETLDKLDARPQDGVISKLGMPSCSACTKQANAIAENFKKGARTEGSTTTLSDIREASTSTLKGPVFMFRQTESAATRIEASGKRKTLKALNLKAAVRLVWQDEQWRVGMYGVESA